MELDALIDDMEEFEVPEDIEHAVSAPPPLPPQKASRSVWVIGAVVILVGASAAVGLGLYMMNNGGPQPTAAAEPPAPAPAPIAPAQPAAEEAASENTAGAGTVDDGAEQGTEAEPPVVVMDEFVFEGDSE